MHPLATPALAPAPLVHPDGLDRFAALPSGLQLCFRTYGNPQQPALLLIAGLGLQLVSWPASLVDGLVAAGYWVITPDNRDMGRSTHLTHMPPARWRQLLGMIAPHHYRLHDMADDMAGLLDALGVQQAHVLGMSMGGMIAQTMAARYPQRVLSLTSIFSTTGARGVGQPALSTIWRLLRARPARSLAEAQDQYVATMRHIGDASVPGIEGVWRDYMAQAWHRDDPYAAALGRDRQTAAIIGSGDRTAALRTITAPTLVIHGDRDLIVHPSGGQATAQAIAGAVLHVIAGMRHQLDSQVTPQLLSLIVPHLHSVDAPPSNADAAPGSAAARF